MCLTSETNDWFSPSSSQSVLVWKPWRRLEQPLSLSSLVTHIRNFAFLPHYFGLGRFEGSSSQGRMFPPENTILVLLKLKLRDHFLATWSSSYYATKVPRHFDHHFLAKKLGFADKKTGKCINIRNPNNSQWSFLVSHLWNNCVQWKL